MCNISEDFKKKINGESVLWAGKPKKSYGVFISVFNPLAILSAIIIGIFLYLYFAENFRYASPNPPVFLGEPASEFEEILINILSVFHIVQYWTIMSLPVIAVIVYCIGAFIFYKKYKKMEYVITDRAIYYRNTVFSKAIRCKPLIALYKAYISNNIVDSVLKTGSISIDVCLSQQDAGYAMNMLSFLNSNNFHISEMYDTRAPFISNIQIKLKHIPNYMDVYKIIRNKIFYMRRM